VVFEDVTSDDWYVGERRVSELQKKAAEGANSSLAGTMRAAWRRARRSQTTMD
jgi:hypothetical protein